MDSNTQIQTNKPPQTSSIQFFNMAQFLGCCLFKPYQDFTRIYERLKSVLAFVALLRTGIYNVTALVDNLESSESGNLGKPSKRDCGPAQVKTDQLTFTVLYTSSECII